MKTLLYTLSCGLLLLMNSGSTAQTAALLQNDSLLSIYLGKSNFDIDPGADAVVLFEKGTAKFTIREFRFRYYQTIDYTVERCIKINTQQALDVADIAVPYAKGIEPGNLDFQSINMENGQIIRQKIKRKDLLKEKIVGDTKVYKLNFPNVKAGTIIYYSYTYSFELGRTVSTEYLPLSWKFQDAYPKLESSFDLIMPYEIDFKAIPKNVSFPAANSVSDDKEHIYKVSTTKKYEDSEDKTYNYITWTRKNVKKLDDDVYLLSKSNLSERLALYVSSYFPAPRVRITKKIYTGWEEANSSYFYDNGFLGHWVFYPSDTLSRVLNPLTQGATSNLDMAKNIYRYVRDSIERTGNPEGSYVWSDKAPKQTLAAKKGNITDINILLASLLRKAGIKSYPVILCTTDRDKIDENYFEPDALNYLVSLAVIDGKSYFLDASEPFLPFGVLAPRCYNDFAWLVSEKGLPIALSPDSLVEKTTYTVVIKPAPAPGVYQVKMDHKLGNVSGPAMRTLLAKDSIAAKKEMEQSIHQLEYKTRLKGYVIHNKDNPDTALVISYEFEMELDTLKEMIYFNPFFRKFVQTNPFTDIARKYPVEFGNAFNYTLVLKLQLPEHYQVEDYNNPVSLSLNKNDIQYRNNMQYDPDQRIFTLSSMLHARIATVPAEDYEPLRSLYDKVVTEQNKKIVIRKIK